MIYIPDAGKIFSGLARANGGVVSLPPPTGFCRKHITIFNRPSNPEAKDRPLASASGGVVCLQFIRTEGESPAVIAQAAGASPEMESRRRLPVRFNEVSWEVPLVHKPRIISGWFGPNTNARESWRKGKSRVSAGDKYSLRRRPSNGAGLV